MFSFLNIFSVNKQTKNKKVENANNSFDCAIYNGKKTSQNIEHFDISLLFMYKSAILYQKRRKKGTGSIYPKLNCKVWKSK